MRVLLPSTYSHQKCIQTTKNHSYLFARALPHLTTLCNCSSVQASRSTDLTRLMCVPIPRCIPEHLILLVDFMMRSRYPHRMQTKIPRFQLAHLGSVDRSVSCNDTTLTSRRLTFVSFAISATFVGLELDQDFESRQILSSAIRRTTRHDVFSSTC